ncbi:adenine phosphoribosyltransferase [Planctomycetota bacterium]
MIDSEKLKSFIRTVPDWPKPGIQFRDITTLIRDPQGLDMAIEGMHERYKDKSVDLVVGIEARGFIFGAALANRLGLGFVPIRKKGKLPGEVVTKTYALEYGEDTLEVHKDAFEAGTRVVMVDDLIATGGTALAACQLMRSIEADILEAAFVIDLPDLGGAKRLEEAGVPVFAMVVFEGE